MKHFTIVGVALVLALAFMLGRASSPAPASGEAKSPSVPLRADGYYSGVGANVLCHYGYDYKSRPELFCGPSSAGDGLYVAITRAGIDVERFKGNDSTTVYKHAR